MLRQASVSDLITDRVSRSPRHHVVIAMRRYPRFVSRELRDEYLPSLASDPRLFEDWLSTKRRTGDHNGAFARVRFEQRFVLDDEGMRHLERLSRLSRRKDVYLVCQCARGLRCHRELLLLLARERFGAPIDEPANDYPQYRRRLSKEHLMTAGPEPAEGDRETIDEALARQQRERPRAPAPRGAMRRLPARKGASAARGRRRPR
jgi:hypothetical protein